MNLINFSEQADTGRSISNDEGRVEDGNINMGSFLWNSPVSTSEAIHMGNFDDARNWGIDEKAEDDFLLFEGLLDSSNTFGNRMEVDDNQREHRSDISWIKKETSKSGPNLSCLVQKFPEDDIYVDQDATKIRPPLSRRKSNPFYSPSKQIVDMVKKRRRNKTGTIMRSHSSATILTIRQNEKAAPNRTFEGKLGKMYDNDYDSQCPKYRQLHTDAGSSAEDHF